MLRPYLILVFISISWTLTCQLDLDFENVTLSNWEGNVSDFIINDEARLQLNAPEAGQSLIYTAVDFPDSIQWSLEIELAFPPSPSNALGLWLYVDDPESPSPSGYRIDIGDTGSNDAIKFSVVEAGTPNLLAEGDMGQVASAFFLTITIQKDAADNWTLLTQSDSEPIAQESFTVSYEEALLPNSGFFGIDCQYTSTRTSGFLFDNIKIQELLPDTEAPQIVSYSLISDSKLVIKYNEPLAESSLQDLSFSASPELTIADAILPIATELCLTFENPVPSGEEVMVTLGGLTDESGNQMNATELELILAEDPLPGELLINEIFYDPESGKTSDFVELINASKKFIRLDNILLARANSSTAEVPITPGIILRPSDIIAFANDKAEIEETFDPIPTADIRTLDIPNYVNDAGNVWVRLERNGNFTTIDSLEYTDDFHSALLTEANKEGISLERLSLLAETNDANNWFSAAQTNNYGTPGYANSQSSGTTYNIEEAVTLENKLFTPNNDGNKDFLKIIFNLDKPGYIANVAVYDDQGRLKTYLAENELLGTSGQFRWEGILPDGYLAPIGMYIIYYEIFHPDGGVITGKKVCVLGDQL